MRSLPFRGNREGVTFVAAALTRRFDLVLSDEAMPELSVTELARAHQHFHVSSLRERDDDSERQFLFMHSCHRTRLNADQRA